MQSTPLDHLDTTMDRAEDTRTPASYGIAPGTTIPVRYIRMTGDLLAVYDPRENVMLLNLDASWLELLHAYVREVARISSAAGAAEYCPVTPLRRLREA